MLEERALYQKGQGGGKREKNITGPCERETRSWIRTVFFNNPTWGSPEESISAISIVCRASQPIHCVQPTSSGSHDLEIHPIDVQLVWFTLKMILHLSFNNPPQTYQALIVIPILRFWVKLNFTKRVCTVRCTRSLSAFSNLISSKNRT